MCIPQRQAGADVNRIDRWGGAPLDDAIRSHHQSVAAYLRSQAPLRCPRLDRPPIAVIQPPPRASRCQGARPGRHIARHGQLGFPSSPSLGQTSLSAVKNKVLQTMI